MFVSKKEYESVIQENLNLSKEVRHLKLKNRFLESSNHTLKKKDMPLIEFKNRLNDNVSKTIRGYRRKILKYESLLKVKDDTIDNLKETISFYKENNFPLKEKDLYIIKYYDKNKKAYKEFRVITNSQRNAILSFRSNLPKYIADIEDITRMIDIYYYEHEEEGNEN